jgi:hypothetical protein
MISASEWLLSSVDLLIKVAILSAVIWYCRERSVGRPQTARLLIRAAICQFGSLFLFSIVSGWYYYLFLMEIPLTVELAQPFAFQFISYFGTALEIATWGFIAWAVLIQPYEARSLR